jgi:hypothetical protein
MADERRDIEEPDAVLDAPDQDTVQFWEEKQRELITSVVDYNLSTLSDLIQSKTGAVPLTSVVRRRFCAFSRWPGRMQAL